MADEATTQVLSQITQTLGQIRDTQVEHGLTLATLEERSEQHEKRMNRTDKRSAGIAGVVSTVLIGAKMFFTGD